MIARLYTFLQGKSGVHKELALLITEFINRGIIPYVPEPVSYTHLDVYKRQLYSTVITGLHDGINLRLMRYSDVLLRAAECENEVNGPTHVTPIKNWEKSIS